MILPWLILIPFIGGLLCWMAERFGATLPRWIALLTMTLELALGLWLWAHGDYSFAPAPGVDPTFALPDPSTLDDPPTAHRAQALVHYLTHSFCPFELYSASPAADTPMAEVLDTVEQLLGW